MATVEKPHLRQVPIGTGATGTRVESDSTRVPVAPVPIGA